MVVAFPVPKNERTADSILHMLLESSHIDEDGVFSVPLEAWEIDLLSSYGATESDLEDSDDDEDETVCL
ncbi:MAG: hypothetical protein ACR2Q4_24880 [Geminicoccaceae bacterium]